MPAIVDDLAPLATLRLPDAPNEFFKFGFLKKIFGGSAVSDGCYAPSVKSREGRMFP